MNRLIIDTESRDSTLSAFIRSGGSELYKIVVKRNYRIPKPYIQWKELASILGMIAPVFNVSKCDFAQRFTAHRLALWVVQDAPIYCLDKQLLQQFQRTDIGDKNLIFRDLVSQIPLHSLILLLPKNTILSPDGGYIDWLNIHLSDIEHPEWSMGNKYGLHPYYLKHEHDVSLHFGCVDTKSTLWFSGWGINRNEGKIHQAKISYGSAKVNKNDDNFVQELISLTMQCLMFLTFEKPNVDNVTFKETVNTSGFNPVKEPKEKCLYPRWLRETEKPSLKHVRESSSHSSPSPHWRRGHWRRSAVGEGRTERRWNWIKPTFVAGV